MNRTSQPSSPPSADAAVRLEQAILFMIKAYLDGKILERIQVLNMLEDIIQRVERDRNRNDLNS